MPSPAANVKTIKKFLEETIAYSPKVKITLAHLDIASRASALDNKIWDGNNPSLDEFASQLWEGSHAQATVLGDTQRFQVRSFNLDPEVGDVGELITSKLFTVEADLKRSGEMESSFPPTSEGILAQLMRHNQEVMRQNAAMFGGMTSFMARTIQSQGEKIELLLEERYKMVELTEEMMSRKDEREMARTKQQAELDRKKEMFEKLMQLGPIIVNKIAGEPLIRQKHSELEASVVGFMETLQPNHLDLIAKSGLFNERQMVLFTTVLEQVSKAMVTPTEKKEMLDTAHKASVGDLITSAIAGAVK
jgi:hypothetical protein